MTIQHHFKLVIYSDNVADISQNGWVILKHNDPDRAVEIVQQYAKRVRLETGQDVPVEIVDYRQQE